ncbi:hypothetical protein CTAYLR_007237 [Chrysophaeum taylorii]|uniref:MYND-type domain-containing protein n=1 Tax=Chrysophaeum taylorii TaxID=2483200 RepID=A0AAD7UCS1_9STRA|nr:hypothetical protein CTAYLR_007237 [Chrysophaeum taylorii]
MKCAVCRREQASKCCGRCGERFYCSAKCQKDDWRRHKSSCVGLEDAIEAASARGRTLFADVETEPGSTCWVCCEPGNLVRGGCACRGNAGCAHVTCFVEVAVADAKRYDQSSWIRCPTCKQKYIGVVELELSLACWKRWRSADGEKRLASETMLASALYRIKEHAVAIRILRRSIHVARRLYGEDHNEVYAVHGNIAFGLFMLGRHVEALALQRQVLAWREARLGATHLDTLRTKENMAGYLLMMIKTTTEEEEEEQPLARTAERYMRESVAARLEIQGPDHRDTLVARVSLAQTLHRTRKLDEARTILLPAVDAMRRILGPDHFETAGAVGLLRRLQRDTTTGADSSS